ncbi:hypothetical protein [Mycobacterium asiaticum]|nr:hypothetical protein [Mycobacterium asiaticum]
MTIIDRLDETTVLEVRSLAADPRVPPLVFHRSRFRRLAVQDGL